MNILNLFGNFKGRVEDWYRILTCRFLALPALLHVPRDRERARLNLPPRRMYEVDPELLISPYVLNCPLASDLAFSEEYRLELSRAFSEVYLLKAGAAVASVMHHRPLRAFRDPLRVQKAAITCNNQDPIRLHLNPLLQQIGQPPFWSYLASINTFLSQLILPRLIMSIPYEDLFWDRDSNYLLYILKGYLLILSTFYCFYLFKLKWLKWKIRLFVS